MSPRFDSLRAKALHLIVRKPLKRALASVLPVGALLVSACQNEPPEPQAPVRIEDAPAVSTCGGRGVLSGSLSGAINTALSWEDRRMRCDSMQRPDAKGIRLRFSGDVDTKRLAIIIAMPGLTRGTTGSDFDTNVTISVEGSGRFFSTPNFDTCWTEVRTHEPRIDEPAVYDISGALSCVGPLGEINGDGYVEIRDLEFGGVVGWGEE